MVSGVPEPGTLLYDPGVCALLRMVEAIDDLPGLPGLWYRVEYLDARGGTNLYRASILREVPHQQPSQLLKLRKYRQPPHFTSAAMPR